MRREKRGKLQGWGVQGKLERRRKRHVLFFVGDWIFLKLPSLSQPFLAELSTSISQSAHIETDDDDELDDDGV